MVSVHSSELGPLGWDAVTKRHLFLQKVSSKLGPSARQQGRGTRAEKPSAPGSGTGPPGQGSPGPRQAQRDDSVLGEVWQSAGGGSPARHSQSQSQGIPKPRTTAEKTSVCAVTSPSSSNSKPTANQLTASARRPIPPASSKLPVKGLPTSLSSSLLGSYEISGATSKSSPASPAPTVTRPEEQPSRSTLSVGIQSPAKPLTPSPAAPTSTSTPTDAVTSAAPKPPALRSRAQSVQARTTATGLKAPTVINHTAKAAATNQTTAKAVPAANQSLTKQTSQNPLQRSGSARLSRLNSTAHRVENAVWQCESELLMCSNRAANRPP
ncbi:hypothetical protein PBY51_020845 [Eleginops maclovinus]|uniref:Uncharacterized protein n=1 Tax=Eleginops maclovinus TaxID=56733 RepID=A0AAN7XU72_ELEMC|nr:hypothetical protein PBY51_020845 [Eleginops maclovinus]